LGLEETRQLPTTTMVAAQKRWSSNLIVMCLCQRTHHEAQPILLWITLQFQAK
jgi:hypothetical protein